MSSRIENTFFIGNEEFVYVVEEIDGKYVGTTNFDRRLNTTADSLNEVYDIVRERLTQLSKPS